MGKQVSIFGFPSILNHYLVEANQSCIKLQLQKIIRKLKHKNLNFSFRLMLMRPRREIKNKKKRPFLSRNKSLLREPRKTKMMPRRPPLRRLRSPCLTLHL
jgi:hypothetical protein